VPSSPLIDAPRPVVWKLRATWCIAALDEALGLSAQQVDVHDGEWDAAQRAFHLFLASAAEHNDPATREAAGRLRKGLLMGAGTEQTTYSYDEEVDFGRQQLSRVAKEPLAADAKKIAGIGEHLKRIDTATEALAKAIGRAPGQKRAATPSKRLREALSACSATFNVLHDEITWLIEHTPAGKHREHLEALHAPFLALLERYPARPGTSGSEGEAEPAEPQGGAEPKPD
jgi:hypothetical protein